jgi:hypothetical protein
MEPTGNVSLIPPCSNLPERLRSSARSVLRSVFRESSGSISSNSALYSLSELLIEFAPMQHLGPAPLRLTNDPPQ